jgi:Zinc finger, C2H2 type
MVSCQFCKKKFAYKGTLATHQKTAKYCLEIQGKDISNLFGCEFCTKKFTTQQNLKDHILVCKEKEKMEEDQKQQIYNDKIKDYEIRLDKKEKEIKMIRQEYEEKLEKQRHEYEDRLDKQRFEYISKLEAKLEKFEDSILSKSEKKSHTTTNNTTNNIVINNSLNLNDIEKMNTFLDEKLDKEVLAGGQKSFALLMSSTMLKDKYKCVDPSRQNFEFTNELGEIERDVKAKKLTNAIIKSNIRSRSGEKGEELWKKPDGSTDSLRFEANSKNVLEMINFDMDNSTFRSELSALTT